MSEAKHKTQPDGNEFHDNEEENIFLKSDSNLEGELYERESYSEEDRHQPGWRPREPKPPRKKYNNILNVLSNAPAPKLSGRERSVARTAILKAFNLDELRDLSFDLGIDYEIFAQLKQGFVRDLITYFERRNQMGQLLHEVIKRRADLRGELGALLAKCPSTISGKIQVIAPSDKIQDIDQLRRQLANVLDVDPDDIAIIAAAYGSIRVLFGLSLKAMARLETLLNEEPKKLANLGIYVQFFEELVEAEQKRWHEIAIEHVPQREKDGHVPTTKWRQ